MITKDRVNYLFLLTDGTHNTPNTTDPVKVIQDWSKSFDNKESYGFYVMLHRDAKNDNIVSAVKSNPEMWVVESADINVNILRFNGVINFNTRIDNAITLPVSGPYKRVNSKIAEVKVSTNPYYQVKLINGDLQQGEVTIEVINKQPLSQTPDVYSLDITLITDSNDDFTYIIPASIRINCNNKKERVLKITPKE